MTRPRRLRLLPQFVALAVTLPVLLPGGLAYLDNPPHLAEVHLLATEILPGEGWFSGWSDGVECGAALGQVNGPLVWTPLAALVALGLPLLPTYGAALLGAQLLFAEGVRRLAGRLGGSEVGAALAAILAVASVPELYGVAGSLGGMWPHRLGLALLCLGAGSAAVERNAARIGAWLAAILLVHSFAGGLALGWALLAIGAALRRRQPALAARWLAGLGLAAALAAPFWLPLLDPRLRDFPRQLMEPGPLLAYTLLPLRPGELVAGRAWAWEGGAAAIFCFALAALGWGLRSVSARAATPEVAAKGPPGPAPAEPDPAELGRRSALAAGGLFLAVATVGLLDSGALGPNPWRHVSALHLLILAGGGLGLGRLSGGAAAAVALGAVAASWSAGKELLPLRARAPETWAGLEAAWTSTAGLAGRVYLEDPAFDPAAPPPFGQSHVGALAVVRAPVESVGSWYGVNPIPTTAWTTSEGPLTLGAWVGGLAANAEAVHTRFRVFGVGSVVAYGEELRALLAADPRWRRQGDHGSFTVFVSTEAPLGRVGLPPETGRVEGLEAGRGWLRARIEAPGPTRLRVRSSWHPWWKASLDGQPLPVEKGPGDGLMVVELGGGGEFRMEWVDPTRWSAGLALLGLLLAAAVEGRDRRGGPGRDRKSVV